MSEAETLEYLESEIAYQTGRYNSSRQFYQNANFWVTVGIAGLSALTTAFIGTSQAFGGSRWLSVPALFISGGVTVLTAYDGFLRSKDLWIQYTDTWVALIMLGSDIKYEKAKVGSPTQDKVDEFYRKYENILTTVQDKWRHARNTKE